MDLKRIDAAIARYAAAGDGAAAAGAGVGPGSEGAGPGAGDGGVAERLALFRRIWGVLDEDGRAAAEREAGAPAPSEDELDGWYWEEGPILARRPAQVSADELLGCLRDLADVLRSSGQFEPADIDALAACDWSWLEDPASLALAASSPGALLEEARRRGCSDMAAMTLSLALRSQLEPAQRRAMGALRGRLAEENRYHRKPLRCPVCGEPATAAYVGPTESSFGNGRRLYCAQCGAVWEFERVRCARCGCSDAGKLHYYSVAGDDLHRIHVCEECGGYVRTTFASGEASGAPVPEVEDVAMAGLDALALSGQVERRA